jgi:translation elongation factor P/translation initiation factor 5A
LKGVQDYATFLENLQHKVKIDLDKFELAYFDEDGDEITISNSDDFEE